jgi:hypothetical protein
LDQIAMATISTYQNVALVLILILCFASDGLQASSPPGSDTGASRVQPSTDISPSGEHLQANQRLES